MNIVAVAAKALQTEAERRMDGFPLYPHEAEEMARAILAAVAGEVGLPEAVSFTRAEELLAALAATV